MINNLMMLLSSTISVVLYTICYTSLSNIKFKIDIKKLWLIILEGVIFVINIKYIYGTFSTILCTIITLTLLYYFMYRDNIIKILLRVISICLIALLYEIILGVLLTKINIFDLESFNNNILIKTLFSLVVLIATLFTTKIKKISKII